MDAGHVVVAERLHAAGALITRSDVASAVSSMLVPAGSSATTSVASQAVTWMSEVVPGLRRRSRSLRPHRERGIVGPEPVSARLERHAPSI